MNLGLSSCPKVKIYEKNLKKVIDNRKTLWYSNIAVAVGDRLYIEK